MARTDRVGAQAPIAVNQGQNVAANRCTLSRPLLGESARLAALEHYLDFQLTSPTHCCYCRLQLHRKAHLDFGSVNHGWVAGTTPSCISSSPSSSLAEAELEDLLARTIVPNGAPPQEHLYPRFLAPALLVLDPLAVSDLRCMHARHLVRPFLISHRSSDSLSAKLAFELTSFP